LYKNGKTEKLRNDFDLPLPRAAIKTWARDIRYNCFVNF